MKIALIIQARISSTRLPGKILLQVLNKTLLEFQLERLKKVNLADNIIVATTTNESDQPIIELCDKLEILTFKGSEENVLERYYKAASYFNIDLIVRLTSDCPLIDPEIIEHTIRHYLNNSDNFDYVSNTIRRTFPRGLDCEVFPFEILEKTYFEANEQFEKEHVTPYIYKHPKMFKISNYFSECDNSRFRWAVDTIEDFELIKKMLEILYPKNKNFTYKDCLELMQSNPELIEINAHIEQKKLNQ